MLAFKKRRKKVSDEVRVVAEMVSPKLIDDPIYKATIQSIAQELGKLSTTQERLEKIMVDTCDLLLDRGADAPVKAEIHTGTTFPGYETVEEYRARTGRRYDSLKPVWKGKIMEGKVIGWYIHQYGSQDYKSIVNLVYTPGIDWPREGMILPESLRD